MIVKIEDCDFSVCDLIIPSVSVGNVGQLAVDLLISTLPVKKIAYVWHNNIVPIVVFDKESKSVTTACELYYSKELKLIILQIRSTFGKFSEIADDLLELCKSAKRVVILTGSFAHERKDIHLVAEPLRYLSNTIFGKIPEEWKMLKSDWKTGDPLRVPGSGIADGLFKLCEGNNIPALLIVQYVSEGDNRSDANHMCNYLDSLLKLLEKTSKNSNTWIPPKAWDTVFGKSFPKELF